MSATGVISFVGYCLAAYLLGSVPFGYLLGRLKGVDIRQEGSRNIGATNCWRVCGWRYGLPGFVLDVAKGFAATFVAATVLVRLPLMAGLSEASGHLLVIGAGAAVIAGHVFPIYLRFRGGKAVATSLGVFLGMPTMLLLGGVAFGLWVVVFLVTRYVSVASTAAALGLLAGALLVHPIFFTIDPAGAWKSRWPLSVFTIVLVGLVLYRHRENYRRLLAGTENKFGRKMKAAAGGRGASDETNAADRTSK